MKLLALSALLLAGQATAAAVKIMPFGASIVTGCWRANLWKNLTDNGIKNIDFVGSQAATSCGFPYDGEHEGHPGALATEYVEKNQLPGWLKSAGNPDVLLMHLGTNDVIQRKSTNDIIAAYSTLVDQMRASNPNMKIVISQLIPIDEKKFQGAQAGIIELNKAIPEWRRTKTTMRSPITIVDNFTGFNITTDTTDGEHPNDSGNRKMSAGFYPATAAAIRSVSSL